MENEQWRGMKLSVWNCKSLYREGEGPWKLRA